MQSKQKLNLFVREKIEPQNAKTKNIDRQTQTETKSETKQKQMCVWIT